MHIILGLLAAIGAIGVLLWRINAAADAAKGVAEKAGEARVAYRRWSWRRKLASDPLDLVTDPREAAAVMLVALAQSDGALTERERTAILAAFTGTLRASVADAEELLGHARWLAREVRDLDRCFNRMQPILRRGCTSAEIAELVGLLQSVAEVDGKPDAIARDAIARLRRDFSL